MTWRPSSWATYGAVKKLVASAMVSDKKIDRRALSPGAGARHRFAGAVPTCCCGGGELPGAHSTADPASASAHRILNLRRQLRLLLAFALAPTPARCGGPRQPHVCYMSCTQIYIYIYTKCLPPSEARVLAARRPVPGAPHRLRLPLPPAPHLCRPQWCGPAIIVGTPRPSGPNASRVTRVHA